MTVPPPSHIRMNTITEIGIIYMHHWLHILQRAVCVIHMWGCSYVIRIWCFCSITGTLQLCSWRKIKHSYRHTQLFLIVQLNSLLLSRMIHSRCSTMHLYNSSLCRILQSQYWKHSNHLKSYYKINIRMNFPSWFNKYTLYCCRVMPVLLYVCKGRVGTTHTYLMIID